MIYILHVTARFEDTEDAGIKFSSDKIMSRAKGNVKITTVRCDDYDSVRGLCFDAVIFDELCNEHYKYLFTPLVRG